MAPGLQVVLVFLVAVAAIYDLRYRRIPNWLVLAGLILGVSLNAFLYEWSGVFTAAKGIGLAFLIYFPLYAIRAMGAGDVKLMAAVGAFTGPVVWLLIFGLTAILGGALALALVLFKGRARRTFANLLFMLREMAYFRAPYMRNEELDVKHAKAVTLPHGAVIALGCIVFLVGARVMGA